jgi:hypothetical protein
MLDLNELEKEIDCFVTNETTESYNTYFNQSGMDKPTLIAILFYFGFLALMGLVCWYIN